jgi:hypothetical protein
VSVGAPDGRVFLYADFAPGESDDVTRQLHEQDAAQEQATRQLIDEYRGTESDSDRADIREKLEQAVEAQFEVRQRIRAQELEQLESRLRKLRELHQKRADAQAEIVGRRVEQLIREADGLGWGGADDGPHHAFGSASIFSSPVPPAHPGHPAPVPVPQVR